MDVSMTAEMKTFEDFISIYRDGDEKKTYSGESLLMYAVSNSIPEERYKITDFLLRMGMSADCTDGDGNNPLHVLIMRDNHNYMQTEELCRRLIDAGADPNQINKNGDVPLKWLVNRVYKDGKQLARLLDILGSKGPLVVDHRNKWGITPIELAEGFGNREILEERTGIRG